MFSVAEGGGVTEAEWLACDDPKPMLAFLHRKKSLRKQRLFACACCRLIWEHLPTSWRLAVERNEDYADGVVDADELERARAVAPLDGTGSMYANQAAAFATRPNYVSHSVPCTIYNAGRVKEGVCARQADLMREVFAPFRRQRPLDPGWLAWGEETVLKMAYRIYEDRAFERLPILADALEEASCTDQGLLDHLRAPGVPVRGCWGLDAVLGWKWPAAAERIKLLASGPCYREAVGCCANMLLLVRRATLRLSRRNRAHINRDNAWPAARSLFLEGQRNISVDRSLIETYVAGPAKLRAACAGLTREELTARPGPGAWSILEVVVHLADSDAISIDRMKRMLTEDNPPLLYADETAYVARLHTHEQDLEDALTLIEIGRRQWARVLRKLPDEAFARTGQHNRRGTVTVGDYVRGYIDHIDDHLKFIVGKRANLGNPL